MSPSAPAAVVVSRPGRVCGRPSSLTRPTPILHANRRRRSVPSLLPRFLLLLALLARLRLGLECRLNNPQLTLPCSGQFRDRVGQATKVCSCGCPRTYLLPRTLQTVSSSVPPNCSITVTVMLLRFTFQPFSTWALSPLSTPYLHQAVNVTCIKTNKKL